MILGEITKHNKGKAPQALHEGYGDNHQSSYSFNATPKHVHGSTSALKSASDARDGAVAVLPQSTIIDKAENKALRKLRSFKQFDTVNDTSDHYFIEKSPKMQNPKSWLKKSRKSGRFWRSICWIQYLCESTNQGWIS
ncbi:unnamed protein product [Vicia faba]|uniref:Uncharacterized protein n=1 Tax=Vicia faba TaxID=3906 RepID=A0AAV0Z6V3_VICFA|nr:unnamed protein product [Vicia faba]